MEARVQALAIGEKHHCEEVQRGVDEHCYAVQGQVEVVRHRRVVETRIVGDDADDLVDGLVARGNDQAQERALEPRGQGRGAAGDVGGKDDEEGVGAVEDDAPEDNEQGKLENAHGDIPAHLQPMLAVVLPADLSWPAGHPAEVDVVLAPEAEPTAALRHEGRRGELPPGPHRGVGPQRLVLCLAAGLASFAGRGPAEGAEGLLDVLLGVEDDYSVTTGVKLRRETCTSVRTPAAANPLRVRVFIAVRVSFANPTKKVVE
mmetsp:Transcript_124545/g.363657  ORF Transcript_124545/g.363657 Transcript_124545/m.363657 type:complete len:260 (+) Transcript_124545:1079-1858(+)